MFQSLIKQLFPCIIGIEQRVVVIIKNASLKSLSFSFLMSVVLTNVGDSILSSLSTIKTIFQNTATDKKIGGLSHVPYPMS